MGVKQVNDHIWLVTFVHYDLGYFDDETGRLESTDNRFAPQLLPMCPEWTLGMREETGIAALVRTLSG